MNFYDVHYNSTHVMGTTGGNTADMIESLELTAAKRINPAVMVTHIGGLDAAAETTLNLPKIPGGKKLIYTHLSMPLTALDELRKVATREMMSVISLWLTLWMHIRDCGVRKQKNIYLQTLSQKNKNCQSSSIPSGLLDSDGEEKLWIQWKCAEMQLRNW